MLDRLDGLHALVGGASRGIGRACARQLAAMGATVTCLARSEEALHNVVENLARNEGQHHYCLAVDFDQPEQMIGQVDEHCARLPVQILVNNSGGPPGGSARDATAEQYRNAFNRHLVCNQLLLQTALPGMRLAGYGRVINIISTSVKEPVRNLGVSNTVRGAVANWAKTLAGELGPEGFTVNNVLPGFTRTDRLDEIIAAEALRLGKTIQQITEGMLRSVPLGRFANPEETAAVVGFLASPAAAYLNGINVPVDGGRTGCL